MKGAVVASLAKVDELLDELLYGPAVVKAFSWLPRWWLCDLARLSVRLDDRWQIGYWDRDWIVPGGPCEICGRRASIHVYGGDEDDEDTGPVGAAHDGGPDSEQSVRDREIHVCGWCQLRGQILTEDDLVKEMAAARADSVAWRWRWRVRE